MNGVYRRRMFDVAASLREPLAQAQQRLTAAASAAATSPTVNNGRMAQVAQQAIFTEAVMNAMHARLAELKSVTK